MSAAALPLLLACLAAAEDYSYNAQPRRPAQVYQMQSSVQLQHQQQWQQFLQRHNDQRARDEAAAAAAIQTARFGALPYLPPPAYDYIRSPEQPPAQPPRRPQRSLPPEITEFKDTFAAVVKDFVEAKAKNGVFSLKDDRTGETLRLRLLHVHDEINRLSPTETFGCADFETVGKPRRTVDLDFYLSKEDWDWSVAKVYLHSVNGRPRFAYDDALRRIPVAAVAAAPVVTVPKPTAPAHLTASASLKTPTEDGLLHGGQTATLTVSVTNAGPGHAYGVKLWLDQRASGAGLTAPKDTPMGDLKAGETKTVAVPITASEDRPAGKAILGAGVSEANGFDTEPVSIELETKTFEAPRLELSGVTVSGGSLKPGQTGTVTLTLRNSGRGPAAGVMAALTVEGGNLFLSGEPSVAIGALAPGQAAEASFELVANRRLKSGEPLPAFIIVTESSGRHGLPRQALPLRLGETPGAFQVVAAAASPRAAAPTSVDTPPRSKTPRAAKAYAVVVGIEKYRDVPGVEFAGRDARAMKDYLVESMGFPAENVALLLDDRASSTDLATYFGPWLADRARAEDAKIFIFYAGHGSADPKTGEPFLVPYDGDPAFPETKAFSVRRLFDGLAKLPTQNIIVALDSCFSGMGGRSVLAAGTRPLLSVKGAPVPENTVVLSASGNNQISTSSRDARHGLMTYYLLRGLRGEADADGDAKVTTSEIFAFVAPRVESDARSQHVEQRPTLQPAADALGKRGGSVWIISPKP